MKKILFQGQLHFNLFTTVENSKQDFCLVTESERILNYLQRLSLDRFPVKRQLLQKFIKTNFNS